MYKKINHIGRPFCIFSLSLSLTFVHKKVFYVFLLNVHKRALFLFTFSSSIEDVFFAFLLLVFHVVSRPLPSSSSSVKAIEKEKFFEVEKKLFFSQKTNAWLICLTVLIFEAFEGTKKGLLFCENQFMENGKIVWRKQQDEEMKNLKWWEITNYYFINRLFMSFMSSSILKE